MTTKTKIPTSLRLNAEHQQMLDAQLARDGGKPSDVLREGLRMLTHSSAAKVPLYPRLVTDEEIVQTVERAVSMALEELDTLLPHGTLKESKGIGSNFQGLLADHIMAMLQGKPHKRMTHLTHLNPLFGNEDSFGRVRSAGPKEGYTVAMAPKKFSMDQELYFSEDRRAFVSLNALDAGDLFTSAEATMKYVFEWMDKNGVSPTDEQFRLCLLSFEQDGPLQVVDVAKL